MKKYKFNEIEYELIEEYKEGFDFEEAQNKITDYFIPYDYIVGDFMRIRGAKDSYSLILCKMNGQRMGMIPCKIVEIKRGIKTVSEITFTVNKYYGEDNKLSRI